MVTTEPAHKHLNWLWGPRRPSPEEHREGQERLRERLAQSNGLPGLELLDPSALTADELAERARALFIRDGFVCVDAVMQGPALEALRAKSAAVMQEIAALDQYGGAKGMWQYSFGGCSASGSMMHHPEWAALADLPLVHVVLEAILGRGFRCYDVGGDFNLPSSDYQP